MNRFLICTGVAVLLSFTPALLPRFGYRPFFGKPG